jgi:hypothetical protein
MMIMMRAMMTIMMMMMMRVMMASVYTWGPGWSPLGRIITLGDSRFLALQNHS